MRNLVIRDMVCSQFGWDHRDVEVELVSIMKNNYEFKVVHDHPYDDKPPTCKLVFIRVEDKVNS